MMTDTNKFQRLSSGLLRGSKAHHNQSIEPNPIPLIVRKDLLDDSNAAKEPVSRPGRACFMTQLDTHSVYCRRLICA